jgi:hypothetical protein
MKDSKYDIQPTLKDQKTFLQNQEYITNSSEELGLSFSSSVALTNE